MHVMFHIYVYDGKFSLYHCNEWVPHVLVADAALSQEPTETLAERPTDLPLETPRTPSTMWQMARNSLRGAAARLRALRLQGDLSQKVGSDYRDTFHRGQT